MSLNWKVNTTRLAGFVELFRKLTQVRNVLVLFGSIKFDHAVMKMGEPVVVCFAGIVKKSALADAVVATTNARQAKMPAKRMLEILKSERVGNVAALGGFSAGSCVAATHLGHRGQGSAGSVR
jgi:hypothetical protein